MYKCFDNGTQCEIIILDVEGDEAAISALRQKSRLRELLCPECRQAVQARTGDVRAWHFAHRDLGTCPLHSESAALLKARRLLYEWLVKKYIERPGIQNAKKVVVTVEKNLSPDLPRPMDCYVEHPDGSRLAYWIFEGSFRQRAVLKHALHDCALQTLFLRDVLRPVEGSEREFDLSPTEREFQVKSDYNKPYRPFSRSLDYLCVQDGTMTTLRGLYLKHAPQRYACEAVLQHPLAEMLTTNQGEFVHPGEHEKLADAKKVVKATPPSFDTSAFRRRLDRRLAVFRQDRSAMLADSAPAVNLWCKSHRGRLERNSCGVRFVGD